MDNRRKWYLGATLMSLLYMVSLVAEAQGFVNQNDKRENRARNRDAPEFKVDHDWPKPLPNQWLVGQVAGIAVDRHDTIWIIQRPGSLTADEAGGGAETPPRSECCFPAPSVMQFDARGNLLRAWGGPADPGFPDQPLHARDGLRVADQRARHLRRPQRQRLDRRQRRRQPPGAQVHQRRHLPAADRQGRRHRRQQRHQRRHRTARRCSASPPTSRSIRRTTRPTSPTATRTSACWSSTARPASTSGTGARTATCPTTPNPGPYVPGARRHRSSATRSIACGSPTTASSTSATGSTTASRCSRRTARSCRSSSSTGDARQRLGVGRRRVARRPSALALQRRRREQQVWILERLSGLIADTFGRNGRNAGQFHWVHNLAVDSKGNIYTAEVDTGKRAQKFVPRTQPVTAARQRRAGPRRERDALAPRSSPRSPSCCPLLPRSAHDIPGEIRVHAFAKVERDRLHVLLRIPLEPAAERRPAQAGAGLPRPRRHRRGPRRERSRPPTRTSAGSRTGAPCTLAASSARISLPSDKSFGSYASASALLRGPRLPRRPSTCSGTRATSMRISSTRSSRRARPSRSTSVSRPGCATGSSSTCAS